MTRYERLINRRTDPDVVRKYAFSASEAYREAEEGENVKYVLGAMQPIDPEYTANTFKQSERVQNQLDSSFKASSLDVHFDHQGSVTNDTHVRAKSDIDLLTVAQRFATVQPPNTPSYPYKGDYIADLREVRDTSVQSLTSAFPKATVDSSGSKSVRISGGSLTREIDVVSCAWWRTVEYVATNNKIWLGVGVLDNDKGKEIFNKPFLHNHHIDERDEQTEGRMRKAARLLKNLKYDSDGKVELSSYDIVAIAWNMWDTLISAPGKDSDIHMLSKCDSWLNVLEHNESTRNSILVPNGTRKVFCDDGATLRGLKQLRGELSTLIAAVNTELSSARRDLDEVKIPSVFSRPAHLQAAYRL